MAKNNTIPGTWTAIPDLLKGVGFDIYEIIIISEVQSWTRQNKTFFESQGWIADEYGCSRMTISRKFKSLVDLGILKKGQRTGKGMITYTVNEYRLLQIIKDRRCNLELQQTVLAVTQSYSSCNTELQNNTPKTSNKTSFRGGESSGDSLPKESGPSTIDIEMLGKEIQI